MAHGDLGLDLRQPSPMRNPSRFRACCTCTRKSLECSGSQLGEILLALLTKLRGRLSHSRGQRGRLAIQQGPQASEPDAQDVGATPLSQVTSQLCTSSAQKTRHSPEHATAQLSTLAQLTLLLVPTAITHCFML